MAQAKKCDRCGNYYDKGKDDCLIEIQSGIGLGLRSEEKDLCPDCCEQFNKWLENKDMEPMLFNHGVMGNSVEE